MNCRVNSKEILHPEVKKIAADLGIELANKEYTKKAESFRMRHIKLALLALNSRGWGRKRLEDFLVALNYQMDRLNDFDGDLDDFDYKIDKEISKIGLSLN